MLALDSLVGENIPTLYTLYVLQSIYYSGSGDLDTDGDNGDRGIFPFLNVTRNMMVVAAVGLFLLAIIIILFISSAICML